MRGKMIVMEIRKNPNKKNISVDRWGIINYIVNDNGYHYHIEY